ncbi:hypothetical protein GCM10027594_02330 [Hymenobacter agri]
MLCLLGVLSCTGMVARAQRNVIKINPLSLVIATGNVAFEHAVGNKTSLQLGAYYGSLTYENVRYTGLGLTPELRLYPLRESLRGIFVGPYVRYSSLVVRGQDYTTRAGGQLITTHDESVLNALGGGVSGGYQRIFGERFALELFIRLGYNAGTAKIKSGSALATGAFTGFTILPGLNVGYAF